MGFAVVHGRGRDHLCAPISVPDVGNGEQLDGLGAVDADISDREDMTSVGASFDSPVPVMLR
jgi:hypothetical protein